MKAGEAVFVDSGAWTGLALTRDLLHLRTVAAWQEMVEIRASLYTSVPIALETISFWTGTRPVTLLLHGRRR